MLKRATVERARRAKRKGKMPSSQAGEFVREEMRDIRRGKHGARSTKQAIAIGLSKARRAGVNLPPPKRGRVSERTRRSAEHAYESGQRGKSTVSSRRSRAIERALRREGRTAASRRALSKQARSAAGRRAKTERSASARRAMRTKGRRGRSAAARKAARTRVGQA